MFPAWVWQLALLHPAVWPKIYRRTGAVLDEKENLMSFPIGSYPTLVGTFRHHIQMDFESHMQLHSNKTLNYMAELILTQNLSILTATRTGLFTVEMWITAWQKMISTFCVKYLDNTLQCAIQNTGLNTCEKTLENISSYNHGTLSHVFMDFS